MLVSPLNQGWGDILVPCSPESEWLNRLGPRVLPNRTRSPVLLSSPSPSHHHLYPHPQDCGLLSSSCEDVQTFHIDVDGGRGHACEDTPRAQNYREEGNWNIHSLAQDFYLGKIPESLAIILTTKNNHCMHSKNFNGKITFLVCFFVSHFSSSL